MTGPAHSAGHWDHFWRHTHAADAAQGCGAQDPVLRRFWTTNLANCLADGKRRVFLDLASGDGAVTGFAAGVSRPPGTCYALDYSASALLELNKRYPHSAGIAADAAAPPFPDGSFDLVCSQFGVEYAGMDALLGAGRLVAPGGMLALVIHMHGGIIYKDCRQSLQAIVAIQRSELLPLARMAFQHGFAAGEGPDAGLGAAEGRFKVALKALQQLLARTGPQVAAGLANQLYVDLTQMYAHRSAYAPEDIYAWIDRMVVELDAFRGRMEAMTVAAVDKRGFQGLVTKVSARGLKPRVNRSLMMGPSGRAGAWSLLLERI